ncbi:MAG: 30S ribosomal protein S16 [Candidatus Uhrbacteria bacterium GW2011_GWE2_45_35]|uniref:Small ribosomal subunit protein bS16 n=2 Tax=Candidatus Uhriibacteriota TaxID=1752732 RepID=A0A0G1JJS6_9BACT|nr:MAG: 30S ribosomal protein S16 [Candidatus Uhrbacteria bacterium GW2011_GWF2_44_350]KKU08945.1 MAG: 30S ribosomal protein S16 [Candidatus Uhrbacteria bacterium GW2011_GWE2_45_35]HBR81094.1 30S ribosomal protein S16 [Candidatus Uhrbacteria bacterium]HCU32050.1 30S ribosomal protein S16 [Candidatus Uhrbacteria bacterium]
MLSIRFSKIGKRNRPELRLIVVDKHKDPWGKAVEILGHRNPRTKENNFNIERIKYWISKGAQASESVWNLLVELKVVEGKKRAVTTLTKKRVGKIAKAAAEKKTKETKAEETPAA